MPDKTENQLESQRRDKSGGGKRKSPDALTAFGFISESQTDIPAHGQDQLLPDQSHSPVASNPNRMFARISDAVKSLAAKKIGAGAGFAGALGTAGVGGGQLIADALAPNASPSFNFSNPDFFMLVVGGSVLLALVVSYAYYKSRQSSSESVVVKNNPVKEAAALLDDDDEIGDIPEETERKPEEINNMGKVYQVDGVDDVSEEDAPLTTVPIETNRALSN